jgi:hypothetical protein
MPVQNGISPQRFHHGDTRCSILRSGAAAEDRRKVSLLLRFIKLWRDEMAGQAEDAEKCKSKVRLCSCRWKSTAHNITIWLFLDTEGENRLYSGPKKGVLLTITYSAAAVEPASTHAAPDVTACAPAGEGVAGPDSASPGERTVRTPLAAHHAVPVLSLRCGNTLTPAPVNRIWDTDSTIHPCGSGGSSALCRGGMVCALGGPPAESPLFGHIAWCG